MDCVAHQAPLSMGLSRQEHWIGLPFLSSGELPDPGIKSMSLASPALAGGFFPIAPPGKHHGQYRKELMVSLNASVPNWLLARVWEIAFPEGSIHSQN